MFCGWLEWIGKWLLMVGATQEKMVVEEVSGCH